MSEDEQFIKSNYKRDAISENNSVNELFSWVNFYKAIAKALLNHYHNRESLIAFLHSLTERTPITKLQDQFLDGSRGPLQDICPFTVMGTFNRGISLTNRKFIAGELAKFLGVSITVPEHYDGVPILNNQKSWLFGYAIHRKVGDIDALWDLFDQAIKLTEQQDSIEQQQAFITAYNQATQIYSAGWSITIGLYWLNADFYPSLDSNSRSYIQEQLGLSIQLDNLHKRISGENYLKLQKKINYYFSSENAVVHSFTELSYSAWERQDKTLEQSYLANENLKNITSLEVKTGLEASIERYTLDSIIADGCFLPKNQLEKILQRLLEKKNLVLQGAPGTGKTWLAKRLGFALIGSKSQAHLKILQFHPNLSYEDFVRGWRPDSDGKLSLVDGPLLTITHAAQADPEHNYVLIIEEINRGNPAHLFGDLLTLLEADKRSPQEALELSYRKTNNEKIYLPPNLYIIGTMNLADRSLALMDLALRRRFAFIDLQPQFNQTWRNYLIKLDFTETMVDYIEQGIDALNQTLAQDKSLGSAFQIGHSYFTPRPDYKIEDVKCWFKDIVETEILPLLQEYWFDKPDKIQQARKKLLED
ncbi:AAA family ATPase [Thiolinea disciformis]|uniref:AAA family ATPase n=1 Tax=Thiolinea disciformis TaxID=125614 RepID=UPI00037A4D3A|nr:AAA family ATPase [Thiolinea disciformis]